MRSFIFSSFLFAAAAFRIPSRRSNGSVVYAGVSIAGMDFGCTIDGSCNWAQAISVPLASLGGPDGLGQMNHFVKDDNMNIFRLPVAWQYVVKDVVGGPLDPTNWGKYNQLVQACLSTGASCIVEFHNYARWNGGIIGQGGPTNAQFSSLWTQVAATYGNNSKIIFELVNEPHDLNITIWAATVQAVVTAIRQTGANNSILLPGTDYDSAATLISSGGAAALLNVTNTDNTTTNLYFNVHKYLDQNNDLESPECVGNFIDDVFAPMATWMRTHKRMVFLGETGGGRTTASCQTYLCQLISYLNQNSDVFLGYADWAAGSFSSSDNKSGTPAYSNGVWTDSPLVKLCLAR